MLKKIGVIFIVMALSAASLFAIWYFTKTNNWPLWVGGALVAGLIGIVLLIVFLRRYLLRANEKKFVQRVIAKEGDSIFASVQEESILINDLEKQWEKAIETLYGSKLSKEKNPIYALPWIVVMGESGAGKTTLIKNSHLSSAITDVEASAQYAGTKNCDWWFFEDAIILDTAGRYSVPIEEKRDNAEWERFLSLLSKYRKEEPLNGLVLTISAERLIENDKNLIESEALSIRKRIDQLMISIGAKFPVYLMVTKMDRVYGFRDFCEALPEELQRQAMGYLNESLNQDWQDVLTQSIDFIKQKITALQFLSLKKETKNSKEILLFNKEFDQIVPALKDFASIVFGDNPYQKIPMLRGVYFSSALNDAQSSSQFLKEFNLSQKDDQKGDKACFITDFFKVVLPTDRNLFTPIQEYLSWQRRNLKLAIGGWIFLILSLSGIYIYSYMQNIEVIGDVKNIEKYKENFDKLSLTSRVIVLDKLRLDIIKIEQLNKNRIAPLLGFKQGAHAEENLKKLFHKQFNDYLYRDFAFKMNEAIAKITERTPSNEVVSYIGFLIDSIDILKQVAKKKENIVVSPHFASWIQNILFQEEKNIDPNVSYLFIKDYIAFLEYNSESNFVDEQIKLFRNLIDVVVNKKGSNLHWLTDEGVSQTPSLHIGEFFKGIESQKEKEFPTVSGSLTAKGRANLIANLNILLQELKNGNKLEKNVEDFWKWYDERFFYRWKNFAISFNDAAKYIKPEAQEEMLYAMSSDQNPYFSFIHMMAKEFKAYKPLRKTPEWTKLVRELDAIMTIAKNIRDSKNSLLSKVGQQEDELVAKVEAATDKQAYIKRIKIAGLFNKYVDDLSKISIVINKKESRILLRDFFSETDSGQKSSASFGQCQNDYQRFIHALVHYSNSSFIYNLIEGPKDYIIHYAIVQMRDILNMQWKNDVLGALPLSTDHNLLMSLFNKDKGLVWKYVKNNLEPFIQRNEYGYSAKEVAGYKLDITPSFLRYINSGINLLSVYKPEYNIDIAALPFDVNRDAKEEPNFVNLTLRCAASDYTLKNENYPLEKQFKWVPSKCGETSLTFAFDNFSVKKTYEGENAFLLFLKDLRTGTKRFYAKDFDIQAPELQQKDIQFIRVSYNIKNEGNILKLLDKTPYDIPKRVVGKE